MDAMSCGSDYLKDCFTVISNAMNSGLVVTLCTADGKQQQAKGCNDVRNLTIICPADQAVIQNRSGPANAREL